MEFSSFNIRKVCLYVIIHYRPQTKVREGYVFTRGCDSVHRGGGGGIPACIADLQAHTQGKVAGSGLGGWFLAWGVLQAHNQGVSRPTPRGCPGQQQGDLQAHTWVVSRPTPGCLQAHTWGIPACTEVDTPPTDGYCCRQYASYWNAFLFSSFLFSNIYMYNLKKLCKI